MSFCFFFSSVRWCSQRTRLSPLSLPFLPFIIPFWNECLEYPALLLYLFSIWFPHRRNSVVLFLDCTPFRILAPLKHNNDFVLLFPSDPPPPGAAFVMNSVPSPAVLPFFLPSNPSPPSSFSNLHFFSLCTLPGVPLDTTPRVPRFPSSFFPFFSFLPISQPLFFPFFDFQAYRRFLICSRGSGKVCLSSIPPEGFFLSF